MSETEVKTQTTPTPDVFADTANSINNWKNTPITPAAEPPAPLPTPEVKAESPPEISPTIEETTKQSVTEASSTPKLKPETETEKKQIQPAENQVAEANLPRPAKFRFWADCHNCSESRTGEKRRQPQHQKLRTKKIRLNFNLQILFHPTRQRSNWLKII